MRSACRPAARSSSTRSRSRRVSAPPGGDGLRRGPLVAQVEKRRPATARAPRPRGLRGPGAESARGRARPFRRAAGTRISSRAGVPKLLAQVGDTVLENLDAVGGGLSSQRTSISVPLDPPHSHGAEGRRECLLLAAPDQIGRSLDDLQGTEDAEFHASTSIDRSTARPGRRARRITRSITSRMAESWAENARGSRPALASPGERTALGRSRNQEGKIDFQHHSQSVRRSRLPRCRSSSGTANAAGTTPGAEGRRLRLRPGWRSGIRR